MYSFSKGQALQWLGLAEKAWPYKFMVCFLLVASFLFHASKTYAVSCLRSDSGNTTVNSACTLDGVPKYDGSGNETSRVGIINGGDLTISGADATVQPNTVIVWPLGKAINIQNGARLILGSGASLTQAEPLTYQFQTLGFTVNAAGDPVKVVNNVLQVCTNTTCSVSAPAGTGHAVVEGQLKVGSTFIIDGSGNVGVGSTSPGANLDLSATYTTATAGNKYAHRIVMSNTGAIASGTDNTYGLNISSTKSGAVSGTINNYGEYITTSNSGVSNAYGLYIDQVTGATNNYGLIVATGNVGIGSTAPGQKLEVAGNINSSTGAIQTAGITRVDNNGVGTFAAGTTVGGAAITAGGGLNSVQTFSTSGTWTKPSGVTKVLVEVQGGGGGGGGAAGDTSYGRSGYYGGKGGAGGFCRKIVDVSAVSTVAVTVGAGGGGGTRAYGSNDNGSAGTAGGASSFGAYTTANGGAGGCIGQTGCGGAGGTCASGDVAVTGESGSPGYSPWYGSYLGRGLNSAGHGGNGGSCCGNPYALGNNGDTGTAGNVVVWEYK